MNPRVIAIEGFDGAGKSTLSKYISNSLGYEYHKSPSGIFAEVRTEFDKKDVSFAERLPFYLGDCIRVSMLLNEFPNKKFVLDRYYYSTLAYHEGKQKGVTSPLLSIFYGLKQPDLVFLIKTDFDVLTERINQRSLKSLNDELFLKKELYEEIYNLYEKYINIPYHIIDNNGTLESSKQQINFILKNIQT
jgi:thymidylate kinase